MNSVRNNVRSWLAAFRKRKAKKKKPGSQTTADGSNINDAKSNSEALENRENGTDLHLPSLSNMEDVWSDEASLKSSVYLEAKLVQAKHRIAELEEAMEGKQLALDAAIKKSESAQLQSKFPVEASEPESRCLNENQEVTEFESALAQRDALLSQLSATLFESLGNSELSATVQAQVHAIANHVYQLQTQLHQADKTLEEQLQLHDCSTKAVHDARLQMLQLQEIITHKDQQLMKLTEEKNQAMHQALQQKTQGAADLNHIESDQASNLASIQDELLTKEQAWASRELEWAAREKEWMSREQEWVVRDGERASREQLLQSSIESQMAQIAALSASLDTMEAEKQELQSSCTILEAQLKNSQLEAADKLPQLELELNKLKEAHESDQNQLQTIRQVRQELEEKLASQNSSLVDFEALQQEYDSLTAKYTECLSLLRDSELAKCDLEERLQSANIAPANVEIKTELEQLKLKCQDESERKVEREKHYVELENKYSVDTDALNNKINELQNTLQKSEAAMQEALDAVEAQKSAVAELQKTVLEKDEELGKHNLKVKELEDLYKALQSEKAEIELALNAKDELVENLTEQCRAAQEAIAQKEQETCNYAEQIAALQDENDQLKVQMETMRGDCESLQTQLRELENQFSAEQESKMEIKVNMQKLEKELEVVRGEEQCVLQTVQSLNTKLESFQDQTENSMTPSDNALEGKQPDAQVKHELSEKSKIECDALISKIEGLTKDLEQNKSKLAESEGMLNDLTGKLKHSKDVVLSLKTELENVQVHSSGAKEAEVKLQERDRCLEELQSQLEDTVSQWQRLQRIVQEKEIDLQQSQEMLEEQQRICATLRKTFDEEKEDLVSEVSKLKDALQQEKEIRNMSECEAWDLRGKVHILEGELQEHVETKCSSMAALSETVANLQRELTHVKERSKAREAEIMNAQEGIEEQVENLTINITEKNSEIESLKNKALEKEEEIEGLKTELSDLRTMNEENKAKEVQLENCVSSLGSQLSHLKSVIEDKDQENENLKSNEQSHKEKTRDLEAELCDLRKVCDEIFTSSDQTYSGAKGLQAVFMKKDESLARLQNLVTQLEADLATETCNSKEIVEAVQTQCKEKEIALESAMKEKENVEKELQTMKQKACDIGNSIELLQAAHSEMQQKLEEKETSLQLFAQEKESVVAELIEMKQHGDEVESKHKLLQNCVSELEAKLAETERTLQSTETRKTEIEVQLEDVSKQLSDAEMKNTSLQSAFSEMQDKLNETENTWLSAMKDKENIESQLSQTKQRNLELESNHYNLDAAHLDLLEKLKSEQEALQAATEEKKSLEEELLQVKASMSEAENDFKVLQTSMSELKENHLQTENDRQLAVRERESVEQQLSGMSQQLTQMQDKCELLQVSLSEVQAEAEKTNQDRETLNQTVWEKDNAISGLEKENESLNDQVKEIAASYQSLQSSKASLQNARDELKLSYEEKDIQIGELESKLANSCQAVDRLEGLASSLSSELSQRDSTLVEQASQIVKLVEEVEKKSAIVQELSEKQKALQQENDQVASRADSTMKENARQQESLKVQLEEMELALNLKEEQRLKVESMLTEEKQAHEVSLDRLRQVELESCRVEGELSHQRRSLLETEAHLVDQAKLVDEKNTELAGMVSQLEKQAADLKDIQEKCESLVKENGAVLSQLESLQSEKETLQSDVLRLQVDLDNQEATNTQYTVECKQQNERLTQMTQALEAKDAAVFNLNHDIEMYQKEISDLRTEVVQRDTSLVAAQEDLESVKATVKRKNEEAEMLKANFDSCMEEMQVKLTEQEAKTKRLQSQLAEETRNVHQGKDDLKEMFELQISQMEDKIIKCEQQNEQLEKALEDERNRAASSKDLYEHQLAELELNLQASNSDLSRYKDELSKVTSNHECSVAGLKRLHDIQTGELEDNCMALEKTVAEQKRQINDMQSKFHKEKISLEQNFEIQMSDAEEKRRLTEHEVDRLRRHLEEMKSDHGKEMQQLEKKYESRLFELEDKYCVAASERDRMRASLADQSGMNDSNIQSLETKLQEVEVVRRELEMNNHALEDEVLSLKETARQREEEMVAVLKNAAVRHKEDTNDLNFELSRLNEQLHEHSKQAGTLKADYEEKIQDLKMNNNQLQAKVKALEMHMEHDQELSKGEQIPPSSRETAELQNVIASLSKENNDLKCQLFMQRPKERSGHLTCGVEEICPPYQATSTPSQEGCFSPTEEKPIVEGFVAELSRQYEALPGTLNRTNSGEPDFVEEQAEGFQPEIEHEQVMGDIHPRNIHPILETEVDEGFQPEISDVFVMEEPDGDIQQNRWPPNLSVGMSPSHAHSKMSEFDYNFVNDGLNKSHDKESPMMKTDVNVTEHINETDYDSSPIRGTAENCASEAKEFTSAEVEKQLQAVRDELEEKYVGKLRTQQVELAHEFATKQETAQREMEQSYAQRVQAVKYEWEHKFTKALQKVRKEMEKKHLKDLRLLRQGAAPSLTAGSSPREARPEAKAEGQEDLGETVEQLHKENQELAEVRDVLLQQIEISQARGLHTKVQHELQSLLNNRDTATAALPSSSSSLAATTIPTCTATSPTLEEKAKEGKEPDVDAGFADADAQSETSETSSARERFLEELEDVTQQSGQDLPLEWELTTTLVASAMIGAGDGEPDGNSNAGSNLPEHRSIWEVFDGRCVRQDCQEVRLKLHRVAQWLSECRDRGDEAVAVSDLTLFLDEGFLLGDKEGFFCFADSNVEFVEEGRFDMASDRNNSPRCSEKEALSENINASSDEKQTLHHGLDDSGNANLDLPYEEEEEYSCVKNELSAELELLKREKLDIENKYDMLETQLSAQNLENMKLCEEVKNLKKVIETPTLSSVKCGANDKEFDVESSVETGISVDSGLELTKSEGQGQIQAKSVLIQTEMQEESTPNDRIIHHLQLLLVDKESAIAVLENEITKLKTEMKSPTDSHSYNSQYDIGRVKMLEEQIQGMKASLAAKDRLINALQSDINRLIYPKPRGSRPKSDDTKPVECQDDMDKCDKAVDIDKKDEANLDSMVSSVYEDECDNGDAINKDDVGDVENVSSLLCNNESAEVYVTANESSAPQGYHTALSLDIEEEAGPGMSVQSSGSNNSLLHGSYLFDDAASEHSGQGTPIGLQDKELADELKKLHKDMKETKALYSRENILLQEALHRDWKAKHNVMSKTDPNLVFRRTASDSSSCPISDMGFFQNNRSGLSNTPGVEIVKQRLEICLEQNRMLERENNTLRAKIREQEATVVQLKVKLEQKEHDTQHWRDSFSSQIRALQSQRNDLMQLIRDLDSGKKNSSLCDSFPNESLSEGRDEKTNTAQKIQQDLMERLEELDHLHRMLTQRQVELQHCESERRHLEQLCLLKDLTEMQLMRQKHLMEEQLSELELRLRERETTLVEEKTKLLAELKHKDASLPVLDGNSGFADQIACLSDSHLLGSGSPRDLLSSPKDSAVLRNSTSTLKACHTPPASPEEVDRQHLEAIERLRSKLKLEYEVRTARMDESQAAAIASYWERQHNKQS
ncbi:male barren-3 protein [Elysia marginata]|uniref:Male barren-3 protein n=1 Tax=Elysia marginata TaxID=1093978 RepID=A0AAV4JHK9_9GAST|nr:male barren-3 protein [Elysia marginata]